ncbi:TCF3 fusion partner homolog isoform X2 [Ptychodera flava]|uniref:TCF3 fusion partner homolog isoform X2 n=1 Tax=Ptychodera flava TaxID=63121 RepID=UPI00396A28DA
MSDNVDLLVNGKITNRLHSVKKTIRKLKRERKFLVSKLEGFGDNYCNVPIIVSLEDGPDRSGVGTQNSYSSVPPCLLSGITSDPSFDSSSLVTPSSLPEIKTPQQNTEYKESSQHNHSFTSSSIVQTNCHDS